MIKVKTAIILNLNSDPLAQMSSLIDDDECTPKELREELTIICKASNDQNVIKLQQDLKELLFEIGKTLKDHLKKIYEILCNITSYDQQLKDEEKTKLTRTCPEHSPPSLRYYSR